MFRKTLSAALSFVMIISVCILPASANTMSVEDYAYMDIETAPASMKDAILEARTEIIYSESWSVDGTAYITYQDGTIEVLPKFSDLFPDWDVPTADYDIIESPPIMTPVVFWEGWVSVKAPPANTMSAPFRMVPGANSNISTRALSFGGGTINIGYAIAGVDHAWMTGLNVGTPFTIFGLSGTVYQVRTSTNGVPGNALMQITRG